MDLYNHGVVFKPDDLQTVVYHLDQFPSNYCEWSSSILDENALNQIAYVRIYWVDLANVRRCRIVPVEYFKQLLASNRPGVNVAKVCLGIVYLVTSPGFSSIGEYLYALDVSTLRPLSFVEGHLGVLGRFEEKTPYQTTDGLTSVQVDLCPRTLLKRIIQWAFPPISTENDQ